MFDRKKVNKRLKWPFENISIVVSQVKEIPIVQLMRLSCQC